MTYMLRERPDGQVEIVIHRPVVIGLMQDRALADKFVAFLKAEEPELVEEEPAGFAQAAADVAEVEEDQAAPEPVITAPARPTRSRRGANLPAVVEKPMAPAMIKVDESLSGAALDEALSRVAGGEKIKVVALAVGASVNVLRGHWARHCRTLQRHMAEGGQQPCSLCGRAFTPSISSPDKCARCSHE